MFSYSNTRTMTTWKGELSESAHSRDFNIRHNQTLVRNEIQGVGGHRLVAEEVRETTEGGSGFLSSGRFKQPEMSGSKDDMEGMGDFRVILPQTTG